MVAPSALPPGPGWRALAPGEAAPDNTFPTYAASTDRWYVQEGGVKANGHGGKTNYFAAGPDPPPAASPRKRKPKPKTNGHAPEYVAPEDIGWQVALRTGSNGRILRTLCNALVALRQAPAWQGVFAWNEFSARLMVLVELPDCPKTRGGKVPRELAEADISNTTDWLQRKDIVVTSAVTLEAIRAVAVEHTFHPVRAYLDGLAWDGVPRIDLWLSDHLGAEDTLLNRAFAAKWMIGSVARIMRPGCQFDTALICESTQGRGKSSVFRALTEPWFTDHLPDLSSKDAMQQLQGVWMVELPELDTMRRAETSRIKAFITSRVDRFRPPWGHAPADYPRQCAFAGTVNPSNANGYLRDETGARRFWCVACGVNDDWAPRQLIDIPALTAVRDQLWAEAMVRFRRGELWYLETEALEDAQAEAAEERLEDDPRERKVRDFVRYKASVHMDEILGPDCLHIPVERWNRALRIEIGTVMANLKWRRRRVRINNDLEWRYLPPPS